MTKTRQSRLFVSVYLVCAFACACAGAGTAVLIFPLDDSARAPASIEVPASGTFVPIGRQARLISC